MVTSMARKKISTTVYITPEQDEQLKQLHEKTKVPVAEYIRQGIDLVLEKYKDNLPGQQVASIDTFRSTSRASLAALRPDVHADPRCIRNFSIIAHIDHGKSTLADRMLDATGALTEREKQGAVPRQAWISSASAASPSRRSRSACTTRADDGADLRAQPHRHARPRRLRLRGLARRSAACEGALLVVDAAQGVEAQTLANVYLALDNNLDDHPGLNKIDLPSADPERCKKQIEDVIGLDASDAILASAKTGIGIHEILEAMVKRIPPPEGDPDGAAARAHLRQLVRHLPGRGHRWCASSTARCAQGQKIRLMATQKDYEVQTGRRLLAASRASCPTLGAGRGRLRHRQHQGRSRDTKIGDTITEAERPRRALPGFKPVKPMVFAGIFPTDSARYDDLRDALEKLALNDSSFTLEPETSAGARLRLPLRLPRASCTWRSSRSGSSASTTSTSSPPRRRCATASSTTDGEVIEIDNPAKLPDAGQHRSHRGADHRGDHPHAARIRRRVITLCQERRGMQTGLDYAGDNRVHHHATTCRSPRWCSASTTS